jgi:serine acetyltransferase
VPDGATAVGIPAKIINLQKYGEKAQ